MIINKAIYFLFSAIFRPWKMKTVRAAFSSLLALFCCLGVTFLNPAPSKAAFLEQMAIAPKPMAMGNAVTAYPPGHASIHYNPAGLTLLPEGRRVTQGAFAAHLQKTSRFVRDEYFDGFMGDFDDPVLGRDNKYHEGTTTSGKMYIPVVDTTLDMLAGPVFGLSYRRPGSKWTFGISNYVPYGGGWVHGADDDPTRFASPESHLQHLIYVAPSVGYQLTEDISLGLTVGAGQTSMGMEQALRAPSDLTALTRVIGEATEDLEIPVVSELTFPPPWLGGGLSPYSDIGNLKLSLRDDFSPNYNVGLLWDTYDWMSLGAVYQSPIKLQLSGKYKIDYNRNFQKVVNWFGKSPLTMQIAGMFALPTNAVKSQTGRLTTELEFPKRIQGGIKLQPFDWLIGTFDLKWAEWSVWQDLDLRADQDIQLLQVAKMQGYTGGHRNFVYELNFEDTLDWGVGLEIRPLDWLALRGGYEYRDSPVQMEYYTPALPMPDLHYFGGGFALYLDHDVNVNLSVGYGVNEGYRVPDDKSQNLNSLTDTDVLAPYSGLHYEQDLKIYSGSFSVEMPFSTFTHMLHKQNQMVHKTVSMLNPMSEKGISVGHEAPEGEELKAQEEKQELEVKVPETPIEKALYRDREPVDLKLKTEIETMLNNWKNSWENANLKQYAKFYHPNATQYNRRGRLEILKTMNTEWQQERPESIELDRIHVYQHPDGAIATFIRDYKGINGYKDKGISSLILTRYEDRWVIKTEKWRPMDDIVKKIEAPTVGEWVKKLQTYWNNGNYKQFERQYKPRAEFLLRKKLKGPLQKRYSVTTEEEFFARKNIFNYKMRDWEEWNAEELVIEDVEVFKHSKGRKIEFKQKYRTEDGIERRLNVEMIVEKQGSTWKIIQEEWVPVGTQ